MNHYKQIINLIKKKSERLAFESGGSELNMLGNLINILGEEDFNSKFEAYFIDTDEKFDCCFYDFHKSMRQVDFYDNFYRRKITKNAEGKNVINDERIGGYLDMLFWNLIQISEVPYSILKEYLAIYNDNKQYFENIGKKVTKCSISRQEENDKPFKSGLLINTVKGIVEHPYLSNELAYTFEEDDSMVECRRCKTVEI